MEHWVDVILAELLKVHTAKLAHRLCANPTPDSALESVYDSGVRAGILSTLSTLHAAGLITAEHHATIYAKTLEQINTENY